jgi:hypothetical protein
MSNTNPGCRKCFLSCGRAGKIRDPTRFLFCCDICRTIGYTDCDDHGCGDSNDGKGKSPNDPIGDFIGNILDPTKWFSTSEMCCDQLTKGQLLDMAGRDFSMCKVCNRPNPGQCTLSDKDYKNITQVMAGPVTHNYVYFQSDGQDGVQSCQGLLINGPVPNFLGRGNPNGPDGYVYNHAIGGGVVPLNIRDKYLDQDTNIWYGFRTIIEFIPTLADILPNMYVLYRKSMDVLSVPVNISGHSSTIDSVFQAVSTYGMSGWTMTLSALDKNPYSIEQNDGWVYPVTVTNFADNPYFNVIIPINPNEQLAPTFLDGIVKGQWVPIDIAQD